MKNIKTYEAFDWEKHTEHLRRMKEDPEYRESEKKRRDLELREWWGTLKPFVKSSDVPQLPNPIDEFYTNRLIELGAIPKEQLIDSHWYYGDYRNSEFGKWNTEEQKFYIIRYKFGNYWDKCNHFQDDDRYALFVPLREVTSEEMEEIDKIIQLDNL